MKSDMFKIAPKDKTKNVKERILDVAIRLFYSRGIKHIGINRIIKESNVAKASFYQYFPSKEDLIIACLDFYNTAILSVVRRLVGKSKSLKDFFIRWSRLISRSALGNNTFNGCPIANIGFQIAPENKRLKDKFLEITTEWQSYFKPLFHKAIKTGEIPPDTDTDFLFREILLINEGAFIMWKLTDDIHYIKGMEASFKRLLCFGTKRE
jgi:AcrR family transcriptional regulator